jgi:hypothetical protein
VTGLWTTPEELRGQVLRAWDRGKILSAIGADPIFPMTLRMRRPTNRDLAERFDDVRRWIRVLETGAAAGYEIEWTEIAHRQLGRNRVPARVIMRSEDAALRWIGRKKDADRFRTMRAWTEQSCPALLPWMAAHPLLALERFESWERLLAVIVWLRDHGRPGIYVRQLDLPGVDTKFIEVHRDLLSELLLIALPATAIHPSARTFEARFGFRSRPDLVRFRMLDPQLNIGGLSDLSIPVQDLATLAPPVRHVFITENQINGLSFPNLAESMVIFGLGYGVEMLSTLEWALHVRITYWGDIDTHGFHILDRLRALFPQVRSILMDRATLLAHRGAWVTEPKPYRGELTQLTEGEREVVGDLREDRYGKQIRLEQERVGFGMAELAIRTAIAMR